MSEHPLKHKQMRPIAKEIFLTCDTMEIHVSAKFALETNITENSGLFFLEDL